MTALQHELKCEKTYLLICTPNEDPYSVIRVFAVRMSPWRSKMHPVKILIRYDQNLHDHHDLQYRPGPPAEFRRVSMRCLSHWSGQQQHPAMAASTGCTRNALGSSAGQRTLTVDVHGARELHAPWTADHRGKSKLELTSWRW